MPRALLRARHAAPLFFAVAAFFAMAFADAARAGEEPAARAPAPSPAPAPAAGAWYDRILPAGKDDEYAARAEITRIPHTSVTVRPWEFDDPVVARAAAEWFVDFIEATRGEAADLIDADYLADMAADKSRPEDGVYLSIDVTVEASSPAPGVAVLVFDAFSVLRAAAHPSSWREAVNIDRATGRKLALGDLFEKPDAALALFARLAPERVGAWMRENLGEKAPPDFDPLKDEGLLEGVAARAENYTGNVAVEKDGVRVLFQEYQLFLRLFGRPEITIPLSELKDAGPRAEVWPGNRKNEIKN